MARRPGPLLARGGSDMLYMMEQSFSGRNQSWMARWYYNCMMHGMLTLYPARSLTDNIGFDGTGTHSTNAKASVFDRYRANLAGLEDYRAQFALPVAADERAHSQIAAQFWDAPWWGGVLPQGRCSRNAIRRHGRWWEAGDRESHPASRSCVWRPAAWEGLLGGMTELTKRHAMTCYARRDASRGGTSGPVRMPMRRVLFEGPQPGV